MSFEEQLNTHLRFLRRSCEDYDAGFKDEALRIAVSLRVIFHDTKHSESLLTHLGKKDAIQLISTIGTRKTHEYFKENHMISIPLMMTHEGVKPILGNSSKTIDVSVADWWNEVIMSQDTVLSRKDIVLSAANQDGGAHVDKNPNKKTKDLKQGVGTLYRWENGQNIKEELTDHHFPLLRQMAYEVLNSPQIISLA